MLAALQVCLALALAPFLTAQAGDKKGEEQPMVDKNFDVPAAPALTPEQELQSFVIQPGYRIECVASDPLIHDPVDIAFDAQGRLWVVEMSQLMLDADGTGELEPKCSIAILTDTDGDGVYDQRSEFLQNLVLPRSICFVDGGVLVLTPPKLLFVEDLNGDDVGDQTTVVDTGFEAGLSNPEHAPNAMTYGIDNWIYLCNHGKRYRRVDGEWKIGKVPRTGQWGMNQDTWGRRVYDYNSTPVHADRVPTHYLVRNPNFGRAQGSNARLSQQNKVWPIRLNTGVNRGYQKQTLTAEGKLANYTAACGPAFFTGTQLQAGDVNDVFVCEPAANFVRHLNITEANGLQIGLNAYDALQQEFLSSTDERFRPVNLSNGPDGALYIVDLYRGILQHRVFMTSYLRRQVEERGLDKHTGLGRIWRVVHESSKGQETATSWQDQLSSGNGWTRMTGQRQIVSSQTKTDIDDLWRFAATHPNPPSRLHAAWALEGLSALTAEYVSERLAAETNSKMLAQWIRLSETFSRNDTVWQQWQKLLHSPHAEVRWQLAHSLGESSHPGAIIMMKELLALHCDDAILRSGVLSGIYNREHLLLNRACRDPRLQIENGAHRSLFIDLGKCIARSANLDVMDRTWERVARIEVPWVQHAILQGMVAGLPKQKGDIRYRFVRPEPRSLLALATSEDAEIAKLADHVSGVMILGYQPDDKTVEELPAPHRASIARGKQQYGQTCAACHQLDGKGLAGLAPPFEDSEWLEKPTSELAKITIEGLSGKISVKGSEWNLVMPGWPHLKDQEIADILNYVLAQWSSKARLVKPEEIAAQRK